MHNPHHQNQFSNYQPSQAQRSSSPTAFGGFQNSQNNLNSHSAMANSFQSYDTYGINENDGQVPTISFVHEFRF